MTVLADTRLTPFAGVVPSRGSYGIKANVQIFKGALVAIDVAGRAMPAGLIAGGALSAVGKSSAHYDNRTNSATLSGLADAVQVAVEFGTFGFVSATGGGDDIAAANVGAVCYMVDDQTVALTNGTDTRGIAGYVVEVRDGLVWVQMGPSIAAQIVIAASEASQLDTAQTEIDALQAQTTDLLADGAVGSHQFNLADWRLVSSAGAVGAIAAACGVLGSDTSPVFGAETTSEALAIKWAAGNAAIVQTAIALPADFDDTADATLDLWVLTDNAGGGGIDAATFSVLTSWDNGSQTTDAATDSVPAVTFHKVTATIDAGDIPAAAAFVNIQLVPGTHASDPIHLLAARLNYTRVQS